MYKYTYLRRGETALGRGIRYKARRDMNRRPALAHCTLQATAGQAAAAVSASPHCSTAVTTAAKYECIFNLGQVCSSCGQLCPLPLECQSGKWRRSFTF